LRKDYPVNLLCRILGVSSSGYFAFLKRPKRQASGEERHDLKQIKRIFFLHKGTYGAKRISRALKTEDIIINHKKVARLMNETNLKAKVRQPKTTHETKEQSAGYVYKNLLNRDFDADHPNQKWVTDMTEVLMGQEKLYISAVMDLFNREVIAFEMGLSPNKELIKATIKAAQKKRKLDTLEGVLIHSDQGSVYRSHMYHNLSKELHFVPSMSRKANCWDNAVIESFFSQLKTEFPCFYPNCPIESFQHNLKKYIRYYNEKRIQKRMGFVSPKMYYLDYQNAV
jgi:putative transposase